MTTYAKQISRMTKSERAEIVHKATEFFAQWKEEDDAAPSVEVTKVFSTYFVSAGNYEAQPVKTPCCNVIDVIWGEMGDPEIEACSCPKCGESYTGEPF